MVECNNCRGESNYIEPFLEPKTKAKAKAKAKEKGKQCKNKRLHSTSSYSQVVPLPSTNETQ
jgi:hypothetical protein